MHRSSHLASSTRFLLPALGVAGALLASSPAHAMEMRWNLPPAPSAFPEANLWQTFACPTISTPGDITVDGHDIHGVPRFGAECSTSAAAWLGSGWMGANVYASGDVYLGRSPSSSGARVDFQVWGRADYGPVGARALFRAMFNGDVLSDERFHDPARVADSGGWWYTANFEHGFVIGPDIATLVVSVASDLHFDADIAYEAGMYGASASASATVKGYATSKANLTSKIESQVLFSVDLAAANFTLVEDTMHGDAQLALEGGSGPGTWHACGSYHLSNTLTKALEGELIGGRVTLAPLDARRATGELGSRWCTADISMF